MMDGIKQAFNQFLFALMASVFSIVLIVGSFVFFTDKGFEQYTSSIVYDRYYNHYSNSTLITDLIERCNYTSDYSKVYCVNEFVKHNFKYNLRNESFTLLSPETIFTKGGICRDSASFYCTVFKKMGIDCKYAFTDIHVANYVWIDDDQYHVCFLDMNNMVCL